MSNIHSVSIFKKPRQAIGGTAASPTNSDSVQAQYIVINYDHILTAMGGDDTAKMTLEVSKGEAESIYRNFVGNRASVFVDNFAAPIFDGFINKVTLYGGGTVRQRSMESMANYLSVIYSDNSGNTQTFPVSNAASFAEFGYVGKVFDAGEHNAGGAGIAADLATVELAKRAYPQEASEPSNAPFRCEIEIRGWQYTLEWDAFAVDDPTWGGAPLPSTLENVGTVMVRQCFGTVVTFTNSYAGVNSSNISGNGQGLFYNDAVFPFGDFINTNAAFTHSSERKGGTTRRQFLTELCNGGDGANKYNWGIKRTSFTGQRTIYYRPQSTTTKYRTDPAGTGRIFDIYGALQRPWTVTPDCLIEIASRTIGQVLAGQQSIYINKIEYSQNNQSVTWSTEEDISLRGIFQTDRVIKDTSTPFGAGARRQW